MTVNNTASGNDIGVSFPTLSPGQIVKGLTTVRIAASGTNGASNRFAISVDGVAQDVVVTNATTVDWPWNTAAFPNGSHTIGVTVTDATGRRGTGSTTSPCRTRCGCSSRTPPSTPPSAARGWVDVWVEG